jgi:serine O-acetyltransferase
LTAALALSAGELLIIYAIPFLLLIMAWLVVSAFVYGLSRLRRTSALGQDLAARVAAKRRTRSGASARLTFMYVALSLVGDNCFQATVFHRVASTLARSGLRPLARAVHAFAKFLTHVDMSPQATIGPGLYLYHGLGTVIGKGSTIGRNALICQNVTLGGGPTIGDDVRLWAGAKVIGRVTVGDRSEVGANGVVVSDVPSDTIAVGVPATRHLAKRSLELPDLTD